MHGERSAIMNTEERDELMYEANKNQARTSEAMEVIAEQLCQLNDRLASIDNNLFSLVCSK